jgi:tetratricopeptide (TPR) repeat protein
MSYFKNLYKNDIATPLLHLVFQTLTELRERRVPVLAVTFCYGNLDERIALDVRFVGDLIAALFAQPSMFTQPVPVNWERQGQILTLYNLFQKEKARELAVAQENDLPDAAWVKFNLYQAAAAHKEGGKALAYLGEAVRLDKIYALEYLNLAEMAYDKQRPDEALRMLKLAGETFPDNPGIRLQIAQLNAELGDSKTALHIVRQLQLLPWSSVYQAPIPAYLQGFAEFLQQEN